MKYHVYDIHQALTPDEYQSFVKIPETSKWDLGWECNIYKNGNYNIIMLEDGTKLRFGLGDTLDPEYPECIDMTISKRCNNECSFCYMNCTKNGKDFDFDDPNVRHILDQIHPYTELAVNWNSSVPDKFEEFLRYMSERHVIVNVTIHQDDFIREADYIRSLQKNDLIHGVGVSYRGLHGMMQSALQKVDNVVLHIVFGVVNVDSVEDFLNDIQECMPDQINNIGLLLLGYKRMGRGRVLASNKDVSTVIEHNIFEWRKFWTWPEYAYRRGYFFDTLKSISFDGLALDQLNIRQVIDEEIYKRFYAGNEGAYSFYLDMVDMTYAQSSIIENHQPIGNKSIQEMFESIKTSPLGSKGGNGL